MRFANFTVFVILLASIMSGASPLWAQITPSESYADLAKPSENKASLRAQTGKNISTLKVSDGLDIETVSENLGLISALAEDASGTLYVADRGAGRLWRLRDRNQDGQYELKQALPHRFDAPSGLAIYGEKIYIADRNAVWVMDGTKPPQKLAGLLNSGSKGAHHPLALSKDGKSLYLGLSTSDGEARLLKLNSITGKAALIEKKETHQEIIDLAAFGDGPPWLALEHAIGASLGNLTDISTSHSIASLVLPISSTSTENKDWPLLFTNHVMASRMSPDGYDVLALPAALGQIETRARIVFSGFMSSSGRSVWGEPGPLLMDKYGLLVTDSKNGDIYRLKPSPKAPKPPEEQSILASSSNQSAETPRRTDPPEMQVSTIREGSQIGSVSTLSRGSNLDVGSTIIRDYEPLSLDDKGAEDSDTEAESESESTKNDGE